MDSFDSAGLPAGGSRLLSQSPQFSFVSTSSSSNTGPGGDDLSVSELYPQNDVPGKEAHTGRNPKTRPSIAQVLGFGAPLELDQSDDRSMLGALDEGGEEEDGDRGERDDENYGDEITEEADVTVRGNGEDTDRTGIAAQSHEEKLKSDLSLLRRLNGAFEVYNDALREAQSGTERIAKQLEQTDALLNKYINILSKSEQVTRLIFDERWIGAEAVCTRSLFCSPNGVELRRVFGLRTKRFSRRNAYGKSNGVARRRSANARRSASASGRRRRSLSVRCAMKRSGWSVRRERGRLRGVAAACGAYVGRAHPCALVLQRGGSRGQRLSHPPLLAVIQGHKVERVPRKSQDRPRLCPRPLHEARLAFPAAFRNDLDGSADY